MSQLAKTVLFALILTILTAGLTACGTPTATPVPVTPTSIPVPVTSTPLPSPTAAPTPTRIISASYNPVIGFSSSSPKVGDTVVVNGSGFPPNANIEIVVSFLENDGGILITPVSLHLMTVSDAGGNISEPFKIDQIGEKFPIIAPAKLQFVVSTANKNPALELKASLSIAEDNSVPKTNPQAEVTKMVEEFFKVYKKGPQGLQGPLYDYLGPRLQTQLISGATTMVKLLGTPNQLPISVELETSGNGRSFEVKATMTFANDQTPKLAILEVEKQGSKYQIVSIEPA